MSCIIKLAAIVAWLMLASNSIAPLVEEGTSESLAQYVAKKSAVARKNVCTLGIIIKITDVYI